MTLAEYLRAKNVPASDLAERIMKLYRQPKMQDLWRWQRGLQRWAYEGAEPKLFQALVVVTVTAGEVGLWELMPERQLPEGFPEMVALVGPRPTATAPAPAPADEPP